jgi:hypothetical protein
MNLVARTHHVTAKIIHETVSDRCVDSTLKLLIMKTLDWFLKVQGIVDEAEFGSEVVSAHTCNE